MDTSKRRAEGGGEVVGEASAGLSRRSVLAGAAWSVPVLITATAMPAAAASNSILVAFAADLLQLHWSDRLAAVILIENNGSSPFTGDFSLVLTGFHPEDADPGTDFEASFPTNDNAIGARNQPSEPLSNDVFVPVFSDDGNTLTLTAAALSVPTSGLLIAIYITRPAHNPRIRNYLIAGVFYIDGVAQSTDGLTIETVDAEAPA